MLASRGGIVLGECGADPGREDPPLRVASVGHGVADEVGAASLPRGAEDLGDHRLQAVMGIGDDQLDATQPASGRYVAVTLRIKPLQALP